MSFERMNEFVAECDTQVVVKGSRYELMDVGFGLSMGIID